MKKIVRLTALLLAFLLCMSGPALAAEEFSANDPFEAREKALELVLECAFSAEYGDVGRDYLVRWQEPIELYIGGEPTKGDLQTLKEFIMLLSYRVPGLPVVRMAESEASANARIYFVPLDEMGKYVDGYVEGNWGFVTYTYADGAIYEMEIAIASDVTGQKDRSHLIMEEIVNGLGLCYDHDVYSDSIIFQEWTTVQELSEVDWLMLNMVYHPDVHPMMGQNKFSKKISSWIYG